MKIGEVEKITGLSAKAIRLYEEKGLVTVGRQDNAYREYDRESVERLKQIKLLRDVGVGIQQICLYFNNVITLEEVINERTEQIKKQNSFSREQLEQCENLLKTISQNSEKIQPHNASINNADMLVGVDIGTTTVSVAVLDIKNKAVIDTYTLSGAKNIAKYSDFSEFDVDWTLDRVERMLEFLTQSYPNIKAIGFTGQMHGVLYVDKNGKAVSPLYNWQDKRAERKADNGLNYCENIKNLTGYTVFSGYGFASLYYNKQSGIQPAAAVSFCTIMDYVPMRITKKAHPVMHTSNAASFGLFDLNKSNFDKSAIKKIGLDALKLPTVTDNADIVGYYKNIPVVVAIGDNQASFYGSVSDENTMALVNYGTGSQISVVVDEIKSFSNELEVRPYTKGKYLLCGSALCGGKAYAMLERFFAEYVKFAKDDASSQFEVLNKMAQNAYDENKILKVSTRFDGTRQNPELRGSIMQIGTDNFTPQALCLGVLQGMVDEMYYYFSLMQLGHRKCIAASGNAIQKNPVLQKLLEDTFGCKACIPAGNEEAAFGTALFAGEGIGILSQKEAKEFIKYLD